MSLIDQYDPLLNQCFLFKLPAVHIQNINLVYVKKQWSVLSDIIILYILHPLKSLLIQWMEVGLIGKIMVNVHRTVYLKIGMLKVQLRQPSLLKEE